jgi:uncharacterized membrane protein
MRSRPNMPRWPAWILFGTAAACAYPAVTTPPPAAQERYRALGQEPGWNVTVENGAIDYVGDYGETRISARRPEPRPTFNGRRYEAGRLVVDITYTRCNDAMSGHGYEHRVMVVADGRTVTGCGGQRRPDLDV